MKKKEARKLKAGDQLVMMRDGSYGAAFKVGDMVSFAMNKNSQKMVVSGLGGGRRIDQTISRKDVELYTERPHEALRATYKAGQRWEFRVSDKRDWLECGALLGSGEPRWHEEHEYRLKPEPPKQTAREQLIAAGVPDEELAKVVDERLDKVAASCALIALQSAFCWGKTPQGNKYWGTWYDRLNGKDVTIPEPLDAAPELYCLVYGDVNCICSINGSVTITAGTLDQCNKTAEHLRGNYPSEKYRIMRLTPVDSGNKEIMG